MNRTALAALALVAGLLLPAQAQEGAAAPTPEPAPGLYATLHTSMGQIRIRLYEKESPETVRNFAELATGGRMWQESPSGEVVLGEPFYDGLIFHRVISGFMIQTGSFPPYGRRNSAVIPDELDNGLKFNRGGLLGMANAGPNTGSSAFFITHGPTPGLNGKHTIFGEVVSGQLIVARIGGASRDEDDRPYNDITLFKVTLERVGPAPSPMTEPGLYAVLETSLGEVTIKLFEKEAPLTVAHITELAEGKRRWKVAVGEVTEADLAGDENWTTGQPYFDGMIFHRVRKNFMSQSGGHLPDDGQRFSDVVADEFGNGLKYDRPGRVGMAHAGPGTARAQFFITHLPVPRLDGNYTVFGQVVDGIGVVWKMANGTLHKNERGEDAVPDPQIILKRVTIHRVE